MGDAYITRRGGGGKINGVKGEYTAGGIINNGDFVSINLAAGQSVIEFDGYNHWQAQNMTVVPLSDSRAIAVFCSSGYYQELHAATLDISAAGSITVGPDTQLSTVRGQLSSDAPSNYYAVGLDASHVFVACSDGSSNRLSGTILTVDAQGAINATTPTLISTDNYTARNYRIVKMTNSQIFIYGDNDAGALYGVTLDVSNNAISNINYEIIKSKPSSSSYSALCVVKLDETHVVCFAELSNDSFAIQGGVFSPGGTSISLSRYGGTDITANNFTWGIKIDNYIYAFEETGKGMCFEVESNSLKWPETANISFGTGEWRNSYGVVVGGNKLCAVAGDTANTSSGYPLVGATVKINANGSLTPLFNGQQYSAHGGNVIAAASLSNRALAVGYESMTGYATIAAREVAIPYSAAVGINGVAQSTAVDGGQVIVVTP